MRHLVPQRRRPTELPWRTRGRRIERDDAPEAGAERTDEARQPDRADREVVVFGEHLDENRARRFELVPLGKRVQRLPREQHDMLTHDARFVRVQADDEVAVTDRLERVDRVEHREQVEGDDVERIGLERRLERPPRIGFVAGAQQVHAQVGIRPCAGLVDLERSSGQLDRLVKPVVARRMVTGHAVDIAVDGIQGKGAGSTSLEVAGTGLEEGDRGIEGPCFQAVRIHCQRLPDRCACIIALTIVERQLGDQEVRGDVARIDLQRSFGSGLRGSRVLLKSRFGKTDTRRHVVGIRLQRSLERSNGVGAVVLLEKQLAPRRIDRRIVRRHRARAAQVGIGILKAVERARRQSQPHDIGRRIPGPARQHQLQQTPRLPRDDPGRGTAVPARARRRRPARPRRFPSVIVLRRRIGRPRWRCELE